MIVDGSWLNQGRSISGPFSFSMVPEGVISRRIIPKFFQFGLFKPRRFWQFNQTSFAENARTGQAHGQSKHEESKTDFMGQRNGRTLPAGARPLVRRFGGGKSDVV
jgi:hypothetical protein